MKNLVVILLFAAASPASAVFIPSGSPIQVNVLGSSVTAGYQNGSSSVPVSIINAAVPISGSISNTSFIATQSVDSTLNASVSIKGSSNTVSAAQSGTWTVQPGNTQNTTGWLVVQSTSGVNASTMTVVISGTPPHNLTQVGGNTVAVSGTSGEQRISAEISGTSNTVVLGAGAATIGALTANQSVNIAQVGGNTTALSGTAGQMRVSAEISGTSNTVVLGAGSAAIGVVNVNNLYSGTTVQVLNSTVAVHGYLSDNGAAAATNRIGTISGVVETSYNNGTAATVGRDSAESHGTDGLLWTAVQPSMRPAWFSASTNTFTTASASTDITALCGNASNTVIVTGLRLSCTQTTAGIVTLQILKRSTKFTGAWSTMTAVGMNSNYALTNSTAVFFTANPTQGTLLAPIDSQKLGCMATATASSNDIYISPANWRNRALVLNGAAECVTANLLGATVTGGAFSAAWDWIETATITP